MLLGSSVLKGDLEGGGGVAESRIKVGNHAQFLLDLTEHRGAGSRGGFDCCVLDALHCVFSLRLAGWSRLRLKTKRFGMVP